MRYFILAGKPSEAADWCASKGVSPHSTDVRILNGARAAEGNHVAPEDELVLTGTWWRHPDLREIVRTMHRNLAKTRSRNHQIASIIDPLVADWREQDRRVAAR